MSDVTPGPWMLGVSTNVEYGPWPCFRLSDMRDPTDAREIEADRRLMEAAPELLAALEAIVSRIEVGATSRGHAAPQDTTFAAARDAIANAKNGRDHA